MFCTCNTDYIIQMCLSQPDTVCFHSGFIILSKKESVRAMLTVLTITH